MATGLFNSNFSNSYSLSLSTESQQEMNDTSSMLKENINPIEINPNSDMGQLNTEVTMATVEAVETLSLNGNSSNNIMQHSNTNSNNDSNTTTNNNTKNEDGSEKLLKNSSSTHHNRHHHHHHSSKSFKVEIPRISSSRDLHPQRAHSPVVELEQRSHLFNAPASKKEPNKLSAKIRTAEVEESIKKAKKFAMEQSVRFALVKQQQQQQKQQLELIKKQQALLLMCRIYVGSIFYEVKEEAVRVAFGAFGPIRSITMSWDAATNKHKGFAFIEFETPEAAQLAYEQMNGCLLGGRNIKVGRPSNMPQAQPIIDQLTEESKLYNRIYVASIHHELSEQDVQSVFEAFGTIKCSLLVRDPQTGKHKGYGFIEYETAQSAQDAIASMNLFDLGGQFLRVGKAVTPPDSTPQTTTSLLLSSNISSTQLASQMQENDKNSPFTHNPFATSASSSSLSSLAQSTGSNLKTSLSSSNLQATVNSQTTNGSTQIQVQTTQLSEKESETHETKTKQVTTSQQQINTISPSVKSQANTQQVAPQTQTLSQSHSVHPGDQYASKLIELTENQKKLLGMTSIDDPQASLEQQTEITLKGKEQRMILMQKLMQRKPESRVLILRNMVGPEDVDSELENEITDECGKFGEVERVVIYQEKQSEEEDAEIIVKIFVEFSSSRSIEKAVEALNGRFFAGRVVRAQIYDQAAYDAKDYSG